MTRRHSPGDSVVVVVLAWWTARLSPLLFVLPLHATSPTHVMSMAMRSTPAYRFMFIPEFGGDHCESWPTAVEMCLGKSDLGNYKGRKSMGGGVPPTLALAFVPRASWLLSWERVQSVGLDDWVVPWSWWWPLGPHQPEARHTSRCSQRL